MAPVSDDIPKRLSLVERGTRDHAKSLSALVESVQKGFTTAQLEQLRVLFREELADAGLRIDDPEHVDDARRDFMFLRSLRQALNGTASKIGWFFIAAILAAIVWLVNAGLNSWKG